MRNKTKQVFKKRQSPLITLLFLSSAFVATPALWANAHAEEKTVASSLARTALSLEKQRALFLQTEQHIKMRRFKQARENMQQLQSYALYPYLEAAFLQQNLSLANESLISEFLIEFSGLPAAERLRTAWLQYLAKQNQGEKFLLYYQGSSNPQLQCHYLDFLWQSTDNLTALWPQVSHHWVSEKSLPASCDAVFNAWVAAGMRTEEIIWQRFSLAVQHNQHRLALYLARLLPEESRYLTELSRKAWSNPRSIMRFQNFTNQDEREKEIIIAALQRLVWRDIDDAQSAWLHYQTAFKFSTAEQQEIDERIGITLSVRGEENALVWLEKVPVAALSDAGRQWTLAAHLRQQRHDKIIMFINALPESEQQKDQWRYWRARSLMALNFIDDGEEELHEVAKQRSYYGFLASARLGVMPSLAHEPIEYEAEAVKALKNQPSMQRAVELFMLKRTLDARREWNVIGYRGSYKEQVLSALFAYEQGYYDQTIFGLARTGLLNDIERRFPLAFKELLAGYAESQSLDPAWVYAIVRRESAFQVDAVSPAGARGLMQVMPQTANYLVRRTPGAGTRISSSRLMNVEDNVQLGTRYMSELLQRSDNNWIIATAAYNAGINRVVEWLPEQPMDFDVWLEMVPYQETRDYVKSVLAYQQIYTILLGGNTNVLSPLVGLQIYANHHG